MRMKKLMESVLASALLAVTARAEVPIDFNLSDTGRVSMAVYDGQGRQVRSLLYGANQDAGPHKVTWDGLDWTGRPASPGIYEWRLLESQG